MENSLEPNTVFEVARLRRLEKRFNILTMGLALLGLVWFFIGPSWSSWDKIGVVVIIFEGARRASRKADEYRDIALKLEKKFGGPKAEVKTVAD